MTDQHVPQPIADRPRMPDGYGVPEDREGLIPWEHVVERLTEAQNYWVATVDRRGRPHSTPVWGAYLRGLVFLDGSTETQRGRNMAANQHVAVHLESASDVVIVKGRAEKVEIDEDLARLLSEDAIRKYAAMGYRPSPDSYLGQTAWAVRPRTVFAWTEFPKTVTRFRFT